MIFVAFCCLYNLSYGPGDDFVLATELGEENMIQIVLWAILNIQDRCSSVLSIVQSLGLFYRLVIVIG